MDRFIAVLTGKLAITLLHLKSNMDRFIESTQFVTHCQMIHLKSNMDRFIAPVSVNVLSRTSEFKIQYG